jgi:hypothetical protein
MRTFSVTIRTLKDFSQVITCQSSDDLAADICWHLLAPDFDQISGAEVRQIIFRCFFSRMGATFCKKQQN